MTDVDPLYVILAFVALAIGIVVYLRAAHEDRIKKTVAAKYEATEKVFARPAFDSGIVDLKPPATTDKAARIKELEALLASGAITQSDFDTAKIKIAFE